MSNPRLLDRQISLLTYLTSDTAVFGDHGGAPDDEALRGFDIGRLRLEAVFSFEKRIAKIEGVFPKTLARIGRDRDAIYRGFVAAYPPASIDRYDNARQFLDHLREFWKRYPPEPPYLPDIAAFELTLAKVRGRMADPENPYKGPRPAIRLHPRAELLRCEHDIRPLFEAEEEGAEADPRGVFLAITIPDDAVAPAIFQLAPEVYHLLELRAGWLPLSEFESAARSALLEVADALSGTGLIEVAL